MDNVAPLVSLGFNGTHEDEEIQFTWHYESEDDFSHHVLNSLYHDDIATQDTLRITHVINAPKERFFSSFTSDY